MKRFTFLFVLVFLVACGGQKSSSQNGQDQNPRAIPMCPPSSDKAINCLRSVQWILNTRLTSLPKKIQIDRVVHVNGLDKRITEVDACKTAADFKVISSATGSSIFLKIGALFSDEWTLEIIDRDQDCKGSTVLIKKEITQADIRFDDNGSSFNASVDLD